MLRFARTPSRFLFDDIPICQEVQAPQLSASLAAEVRTVPGSISFSFLQVDARPISAFVTFAEGLVHSGYFWAYVPSSGWDDHERVEKDRRAIHEDLMQELFGALQFEDNAMVVDLARDPRSGLEQITFRVK